MKETTAKIWLYVVLTSVFMMTKINEAFKSMTSASNMLITALLGFGTAMYYGAGAGAAIIITGGLAATSLAWITGFATLVVTKLVVMPLFNKVMSFFKKDEEAEIVEDTTVKSAAKGRERQRARGATLDAEQNDRGDYQVNGA